MSLNIKNERVHQLAKEAARVTGKTQTGAIEEALERLLRDYGADPAEAKARAKVDLVLKLAAQFRAESERLGLPSMTTDDLFDPVTGLPR